jgi:HAD superfamily hydrolase (TIGR01509 family)
MRFAAVIFDLDGTLVDTENVAMQGGIRALEMVGYQGDTALFHSLVGIDETAGAAILRARFGADFPVERIGAIWDRECDRLMAEQGLPVKPGVLDLLARLDALALPRAIATSGRRDRAGAKLVLAGLVGRFDPMVCFDDVSQPKPHPEPYLLAAGLLGVPPVACVVFEDSDTGAEAAHRAGCTVVQVPDLIPGHGRFAHYTAPDILTGAAMAGLI